MEQLVEFIKTYLLPGSFSFLLLGLILGITLLFLRGKASRWGKGLLISLTLAYLLMSVPIIPHSLETLLSNPYSPVQFPDELGDIQAIVILGGGGTTYERENQRLESMSESTSLRVLEGARLYQMLGQLPVFVSGGAAETTGARVPQSKIMANALIGLGVVEGDILEEPRSGNTYEQAIIVGEMLMDEGIEAFLLVTSPTHMYRSLATFRAQGLSPEAAISMQHSPHHPVSRQSFFPSNDALGASQMVFRELMALFYYKVSGRMTIEG
jgi:uncharacterized SAM-binding protein YcdF (DUF218 family)